jgi:hypothetical protein
MGVRPAALRAFVAGGLLDGDSWEPYGMWCQGRPADPVHAEQAALAFLVSDLPRRLRSEVRYRAICGAKMIYVEQRDRVPEWIDHELSTVVPHHR